VIKVSSSRIRPLNESMLRRSGCIEVSSKAGVMEADLTYLDLGRVSTPDGPGGDSDARVSIMGEKGTLVSKPFGCATLYEIFQHGIKTSNDGPCLGWRPAPDAPYTFHSYSVVHAMAKDFVKGLTLAGGLERGNPESFLGIYSQNRVEWMVAAIGCWMMSNSIVPLYDTLGPEACGFIMDQTEMVSILCDTQVRAQAILDKISPTSKTKFLILVNAVDDAFRSAASEKGVSVLDVQALVAAGKANDTLDTHPPKPSDLGIVCYTSGTTGNPKGVMITHANYCGTVAGLLAWAKPLNLGSEEAHICYLPLAHVLEQSVFFVTLALGGKVGFYQGDIKLLTSDMQALQPTLFPTVPRLLNRIHDTVRSNVKDSRIKEFFFNLALSRKQAAVKNGVFQRDTIWDYIAFKKIHDLLGGRLKAIFSGSAPLDPEVMEFARAAMGAYVVEGYGQTECSGVAVVQLIGENATGEIGPPIPCTKIKLVDVPEMSYFASENKGEICIKGTNVFQGYYKDPERTRETLDSEGWLHTGDIGTWSDSGSLKIIDRKKNIFKLAQGEYVAPEKIEIVYARSSFVAQVFVHGESLKSVVVAVIVPDEARVRAWAKTAEGVDEALPFAELTSLEALKKTVLDDIVGLGKQAKLASFEQVKDIYLDPEIWTAENDLLTPTFKAKRPALLKKYRAVIDKMYEKLW